MPCPIISSSTFNYLISCSASPGYLISCSLPYHSSFCPSGLPHSPPYLWLPGFLWDTKHLVHPSPASLGSVTCLLHSSCLAPSVPLPLVCLPSLRHFSPPGTKGPRPLHMGLGGGLSSCHPRVSRRYCEKSQDILLMPSSLHWYACKAGENREEILSEFLSLAFSTMYLLQIINIRTASHYTLFNLQYVKPLCC